MNKVLSEIEFLIIGKEDIQESFFNEVTNSYIKPYGGLWSSPYIRNGKFKSEWDRWCKQENFIEKINDFGVTFTLKKDAKILIIDSYEDLVNCISQYPFEDIFSEITGKKNIDFEKLKLDYDGFFLTSVGELETRFTQPSLYGFDVECLLLFNLNCIDTKEKISW